MNAIHIIVKRDVGGSPRAVRTACGRVGWKERMTNDEYSTAEGFRFEASESRRLTSCKKCLAALPSPPITKIKGEG